MDTVFDPAVRRAQTKKLGDDIVRRSPDAVRVPVTVSTSQWPIFEAGYKLREGLMNYELQDEIIKNFHLKFDADFYSGYFSRYCERVTAALGGGGLLINDEQDAHYYINEPMVLLEEIDYVLESGLAKTYFEKVFPRKYQSFVDKDDAMAKMAEALKEENALRSRNAAISEYFVKEFGVPSTYAFAGPRPLDDFLQSLGMKAFSKFLRRASKQHFMDVVNVWDNGALATTIGRLDKHVDNDTHVFGLGLTSTSASFLSLKQFEMYHWPLWKPMLDKAVEVGMTAGLFLEGTFEHFSDILRDLPKGHFIMTTEQDDVARMAGLLPNLSFHGGFPTYLLGHGTPQECIDTAKALIDACARQLVVCSNKMLSYPNDADSDNLLALIDFVKEYSKF
ncbi:MAG: hypothetical protein FWG10_07755 [Eubacteriaceae bacterium]|nr:hypothetical protein [Eubacteriaceae bacterium]